VAQAKRDVAELIRIGQDVNSELPKESPLYDSFYNVKFEVNRDKRTVVALILYNHVNKVRTRGIAKAAPGDVFNASIGRAIALRRALGLPVPTEYTNAPQPTEPRVGDVVYKNCGIYHGNRTLLERVEGYEHDKYGHKCFRTDGGGWLGDKQFVIIDDSRESEVSA